MITHVIVELEFPVEEEYWSQVDYADEYYGSVDRWLCVVTASTSRIHHTSGIAQ